jgi:hypothetical protein
MCMYMLSAFVRGGGDIVMFVDLLYFFLILLYFLIYLVVYEQYLIYNL